MYLIKRMVLYENLQHVFKTRDGMRAYPLEDPIRISLHWGRNEAVCSQNFDFSIFPKTEIKGEVLLTYVSSYEISEYITNGYRKVKFFVDKYEPDNIEGYILSVAEYEYSFKTNGEKLNAYHASNTLVVLREGEYIKFNDGKEIKIAEVINGELILAVKKK